MKNESRKLLIEYLYGIKSKDSEDSEFWELLEDESVRSEYKDITLIDKEIANIAESIKPSEQIMASVFKNAGVTISTGVEVSTTGTSAGLFGFKLIPLFFTMMLITSPFYPVDTEVKTDKLDTEIATIIEPIKPDIIDEHIAIVATPNTTNIVSTGNINRAGIAKANTEILAIEEPINDAKLIDNNNKLHQVTLSNIALDNTESTLGFESSPLDYDKTLLLEQYEPPTVYSKIFVQLSALTDMASYNTDLTNDYTSQFNNYNVGIKYQLFDYLAFGVDYYQETYFLNYREYQGIIPIRDIEQFTNTSSYYGSAIVSYPLFDEFASPYIKASLGLNKFGVTDRYTAGITLQISDKFSTFFEYGVSNLRYTNQNRAYTSDRTNITLGIQTSLNNLGIK